VAATLLQACATNATVDKTVSAEERRVRLVQLDNFTVNGSIGIWTDDENISARLKWQQRGDEFDFLLTAPAGLSSLKMTSTPDGAVLKRGNAAPVAHPSASILLQTALNLAAPVPIEQMSQWLRGLPGNSDSAEYDASGRLESMTYRDEQGTIWRAKILRYQQFSTSNVPALISATGGPYNVRLVMKTWTLGAETKALVSAADTPAVGRKLNIPGR